MAKFVTLDLDQVNRVIWDAWFQAQALIKIITEHGIMWLSETTMSSLGYLSLFCIILYNCSKKYTTNILKNP